MIYLTTLYGVRYSLKYDSTFGTSLFFTVMKHPVSYKRKTGCFPLTILNTIVSRRAQFYYAHSDIGGR